MSIARTSPLRDLARRWIALWCAPVDWQLFDQLHADDFEDCSPSGRAGDKVGFASGLRAMISAFPDLHTEVEDLVVDAEASKVAVRWRATGTNRAPFLGIGPTHQRTSFAGIEIIQVAAGRIVRRWGEWDASDFVG